MDLPSECPYCDSVELNYTYVRHLDPRQPARPVFTWRTCGAHVESDAADVDPPVDDPRWTITTASATRDPHVAASASIQESTSR